MSLIDIAIIFVLVLGGVFGWRRGFFRTISYVCGGAIGCWAGSNFYAVPGTIFSALRAHAIVSYFIVFAVFFGGLVAAGLLLNKLSKRLFLGFIDRAAGLFTGVVLGICITGAVLVPLVLMKVTTVKKMVKHSVIASGIAAGTALKVVEDIAPALTDLEKDYIRPVKKHLKKLK